MPAKWQRWMPLDIDKFRGSPSVQAMHPAARSGYLYLLMFAWQTDDCTVPSDPLDLAEAAGLTDEYWREFGPRIQRKFVPVEGTDRLQNPVLFDEWNKARVEYEKNHGHGRAGAKAKWGDDAGKNSGSASLLRSQRLSEARKKGTHTSEQWDAMLAFCQSRCVRCGVEGVNLVKDHITPIYQEGSDGIDNLQPLCAKCNSSKGPECKDFRPDGWRDACKMSAQADVSSPKRLQMSGTGTYTETKDQDPPKGAHEGENDSPDLFPDGLHVNQYASGILERNGVPNGFQMIDATARAITAVATIIKKPLHVAAQGLETRLIVAIQRGETVNRYWMDDSKWRSEGAANGQNHSSPAKQRVGAGVRAFAAAGAAARAARAVGDSSPADGPALPAPGPQRVGGDVSGRLRSVGGDVQPALGHRSTARTAN